MHNHCVNADIDKYLDALERDEQAMAVKQPRIDINYALLETSHSYNGLSLDLYGEIDENGYQVYDVALTGTTTSLFELVSEKLLKAFSQYLDDHLPSPAQLKEDSRQEARITAAEF
jgi:hypothetical protein